MPPLYPVVSALYDINIWRSMTWCRSYTLNSAYTSFEESSQTPMLRVTEKQWS